MVNMESIALDTNIVIDILNDKQSTIRLLKGFPVICLPIVVCGELLFGALNSKKHGTNVPLFHNFIKSCSILETNILVAEQYAEIRLQLKLSGKPIPENDIWIAALCIVNEIPLLTFDNHFTFIKNLNLVTA